MSRSQPPKCPTGRGCWCCGDAGAIRRQRDAQGLDAIHEVLADPSAWVDINSGVWELDGWQVQA